jgi:hypothetical protein
MTTRTCKDCKQDKDLLTEFYKHHGESYYHSCRTCKSNKNNRRVAEPKVRGFAALGDATKNMIMNGMQDAKNLVTIARESGVNYQTLCYWARANKLHPILVRQNAH